MLLTPRIVRTHELTAADLAPIYIGTATNLGLGGPPPLIAQQPAADALAGAPPVGLAPPAAAAAAPAGVPLLPPGAPAGTAPAPAGVTVTPPGTALAPSGGGVAVVPPGSSPIPGTTTVPSAVGGPGTAGAAPGSGAVGGTVIVSPPATEFTIGGGPYTVPVSITGASQLSNVSLTITYNPGTLRIRAVQEGSFMRTGGVSVAFTQQPDSTSGRIDIAIVRTGDVTGVAGTGLLAALLFDATGAGPANLSVTGTASSPSGAPVPLQFAPPQPVTVR